MDNSTYEMRLAQWAQVVKSANERPSGQMLKDWLEANDISKDKFYYWQRKVRKAAYDSIHSNEHKDLPVAADNTDVTFAELPFHKVTDPSSNAMYNEKPVAMIQAGRVTIAISNDISGDVLSRILQEVSHA